MAKNNFFKTLLWALVIIAAGFGCGYLIGRLIKPERKTLTIIHVNDTHSHFEPVRQADGSMLGGVIERAAFIDSVRKADGAENVLVLHAGDFDQGSSYYTQLHGDLEIQTINAIGYDAVALGNHEFDDGIEDLARRVAACESPVVCANYDFSTFELGKYVKPYTIVEKAGLKIGIIGLLPDLSSVVDRDVVDRMPLLDAVEVVNKWAAFLKDEEQCDMVISLNHIGYEDEPFTDPELAAQVRNVDLIVGGHSHTFLEELKWVDNPDGIPTPIIQDGCWGLYTGIFKVTVR